MKKMGKIVLKVVVIIGLVLLFLWNSRVETLDVESLVDYRIENGQEYYNIQNLEDLQNANN